MDKELIQTLNKLSEIIYQKKGNNILAIDVEGLSSICDILLIGEGNVERHVSSLANSLVLEMKEQGVRPFAVEGIREGEWVVLDFGRIHVHLFTPGVRQKYLLEHLWQEGKLIDLDLSKDKHESPSIR